MKKLMYFFAIAIMAVLAQSCEPVPNLDQKGTISGVVTDATTGEPIAGCEVYLSRYTSAERIAPRAAEPAWPHKAITDSLGKYEFTHVYFGKYNVAAVADGYVPSDNVEILLTDDNDNDWVKLNFQLEKSE